jgi:hypothetical protein
MYNMHPLTVTRRGLERSALVKRGAEIVAEVFTDREPGDQYETAALIAAAPELLAALRAMLAASDAGDMDSLANASSDARAAIARATGQS